MPLLHLHMWKVQIKRMELWEDHNDNWNDGKRQVENGIQQQKQWSFATIVFTQTSMRT